MILQGVIYMVLGMVVVFAFLVILVLALRLASSIVRYLEARFPGRTGPIGVPTELEGEAPAEEAVAAALAAILARYPGAVPVSGTVAHAGEYASPSSPAAASRAPDEAAAPSRAELWASAGRQAGMGMRSLVQRGFLKR